MDLGVILESPQGSKSSSRTGACTCALLQSGSSSVMLPFALIKGSVAFPRDFPTRLTHRAVPRATMVGVDPQLESRGSAEKQVPLEWTETSRGLLEWWHDDGVPLAFPVESASSEVRRECREFFPDQAAKGSLLSIYKAETGLLWMWPGLSCFL